MTYSPASSRYDNMPYRRCGNSGLLLPPISLGLWQNFGSNDDHANATKMIQTAFDLGITHFDLANNYGPTPGAAEINFGNILKSDFGHHRDEMVISSKAGYTMWDGPYGDLGSRKSLMASIDQSLQRMQLDYVDIFYSHRFDPNTPLVETMTALHDIVQQGKALYVGISNYPMDQLKETFKLLKRMNVRCLIYQGQYSMFDTTVEKGHLDFLTRKRTGFSAFSPLAQGLLSDKYLNGIPKTSRAGGDSIFLHNSAITDDVIKQITALNAIAKQRKQTLAQMAIAWLLKDQSTTTVLVGASSPKQITENVGALDYLTFSSEEIEKINALIAPTEEGVT